MVSGKHRSNSHAKEVNQSTHCRSSTGANFYFVARLIKISAWKSTDVDVGMIMMMSPRYSCAWPLNSTPLILIIWRRNERDSI